MLILLLLSAALPPADTPVALPPEPPPAEQTIRRKPRSFTFYVENDVLYFGGETTDQHYTNGVQAVWTVADWPEHRRLNRRNSRWWPGRACDLRNVGSYPTACGMYSLGVGQTMYTPRDLERADTLAHDRPYIGWTFVAASAHIVTEQHRMGLDLQLGILGSAAGAKYTQSMAHWWWAPGAVLPQGWGNQLKNQLGANLAARYAFQLSHSIRGRWTAELSPRAQAQLGTVTIAGKGGARARAGWNLPPEFMPARIPVTLAERDTMVRRLEDRIFFGLIGEWEGRAVAYNALVTGGLADGDVWRENLELERYGRDLVWGFVAGFDNVTLSHQWVRRSREFTAPGAPLPEGEDDHRFGVTTFTLSRSM